MINSMTGFGRASTDNDSSNKIFMVEIRSVNHRFLDLNVKMPKSLFSLEDKIRKLISENISRGKVDVFISYKNYNKSDVVAKLNQNLADSYVSCLQELQNKYDIKNDISISLVARFPDIIYTEEKEENIDDIWEDIKDSISSALNMLLDMRRREGEKLKNDLTEKCRLIKVDVENIEKLSDRVVRAYKTKLTERLSELLDSVPIDENRLSLELAIFADKSSIDEEITRLYSHISQFLNTLDDTEPIGRKLDFLVQEMNREANTIASKSSDLDITNFALNIKNNIEKIREQIQNIE
ncbi:YicC/YloC family endoribonuclease [Clostridium polynesiense]|uniref:YicC/YloC family endoribonuclease n=1 Tax=Clostridium polynesiense TaxID=1325933 RepID=UPI0005912161|nr:YicC/YloC family endoribonuclease [Clostridium polynesiense]